MNMAQDKSSIFPYIHLKLPPFQIMLINYLINSNILPIYEYL